MNGTDIQINDWVYLSEKSYPMRVESIDRDHCYLDFEDNEGDPFDGIYGEGGIAPIELTKEMLLANGWEDITCRSANGTDTFEIQGSTDKISYRVFVRLERTIRYVSFFCGYVEIGAEIHTRYVHELQQCLRLCGLSDMADNFKIK